jgi:hypothetical protein
MHTLNTAAQSLILCDYGKHHFVQNFALYCKNYVHINNERNLQSITVNLRAQ